jgi:hypothetical protein
MKKIINNEIVDLTAEEISQREADIANAEVEATEEQANKEAKDALKASGKQKLKDLGLDDDEIQALIGV